MYQMADTDVSPYRFFTKTEWARLRADTPLTLDEADLDELRGVNDPVSLDEVAQIYLPMSRLINLYVLATQNLFGVTQRFLGGAEHKVPYIIGLGGSVAVGKSTTARLLRALLARWPDHLKVDLVTTDGFLYPNEVLEREGIMERKGFPESYDLPSLLRFMSDIKAGRRNVAAPVYSHLTYNVLPDARVVVDQPDILIVEGLNVLQTGRPPKDGKAIPYVSDFFDFSIYIDADVGILRQWYVARFLSLRETAFRDPNSFFHRYSKLTDEEANTIANGIWDRINLPNLLENIQPTRQRADLILKKGDDHSIETVALRKL
jgi:type I pantothenate kinase